MSEIDPIYYSARPPVGPNQQIPEPELSRLIFGLSTLVVVVESIGPQTVTSHEPFSGALSYCSQRKRGRHRRAN